LPGADSKNDKNNDDNGDDDKARPPLSRVRLDDEQGTVLLGLLGGQMRRKMRGRTQQHAIAATPPAGAGEGKEGWTCQRRT